MGVRQLSVKKILSHGLCRDSSFCERSLFSLSVIAASHQIVQTDLEIVGQFD